MSKKLSHEERIAISKAIAAVEKAVKITAAQSKVLKVAKMATEMSDHARTFDGTYHLDNAELSSAELTQLYGNLKKFGADALEGRTRLQVRQLRELLLQNIERNEILEAQWREHNPQNPEMQVVNLTVDRKALEAVNEFLTPKSRPADEPPQPSTPPKAKKTPNEQPTEIAGFKGLEAALYFALTHPAGYGENQAHEDVRQFNTLTSGKDLYNKVNDVRKEDFQKLKGCTSRQRPNWIRRLNNVIPHLHTDEQKTKAEGILQHLENQQ